MFVQRYGLAIGLAATLGLAVPVLAQKPAKAPANATAQCSDDTYSTAKTQAGACSKHGGVKTWFGAAAPAPASKPPAAAAKAPASPPASKAPAEAPRSSGSTKVAAGAAPAGSTGQCADGSYTKAKTERGACSNHGGLKTWFAASNPPSPAPSAPASAPRSAPSAVPAPTAPAPAPRTAPAPAQRTAPAPSGSSSKSSAQIVARPAGAPDNATAKCKDGTFSMAKEHTGACSRHGGVAEWYK